MGQGASLVVGFGCLAFAEVAVRSEPALGTPDLYAVASLGMLMSWPLSSADSRPAEDLWTSR